MKRTELIEVKRKSWGKGQKETLLYEATSDGADAAKPVMVFRESPDSSFVGRFESMDDFMRILTTQFLRNEIEIVS